MCFFTEQNAGKKKLKDRFKMEIDFDDNLLMSDEINGFVYPNIPIITNEKEIIRTDFNWGLVPNWSKDIEIRKHTLNARIETIHEKPSYKNIISNRCLIIASGFFEWHWNDDKGKSKTKYEIHSQDEEIFCFAGLYTKGINPSNGEPLNTFTMVTTQANTMMTYIHNHKKRMPIVLNKEDEKNWLNNKPIEKFAYPYESKLIGFPTT